MEIINQFSEKIKGVLSTFDRLIFKGNLTCFYRKETLNYFLFKKKILKKNFSDFAQKYTKEIVKNAIELARRSDRPYIYLESYKESKEDKAEQIMVSKNIREGLICVLSSVESCSAFSTQKNKKTGHLEVVPKPRKCLHLYFYYVDKQFGFMHVRLQIWFPFQIQFYINGREYLARQLDQAGITYQRYDNSFLHVSDVEKPQAIADKLQEKKWAAILDAFTNKVNPVLNDIKRIISRGGYFWTLWQCEYATDIMFRSRKELEAVYPDFVQSEECCRIFLAVLDGGNFINGFSNKIIRAKLYPETDANPIEKKRAVGRTTRLLAKLRAHGLIAKIPRSFRYRITKKGTRIMPIVLRFKRKEIPKLALG